jgi:beta-glucanase (GH16 family)
MIHGTHLITASSVASGRHPKNLMMRVLLAAASFLLTLATTTWVLASQSETDEPGGLTARRLNYQALRLTFSEDFATFRWYAEGSPGVTRGDGIWRTNFGYAGVQDRASRTLPANGEEQIYVDEGFRGTSSGPLGLSPFRLVKGAFSIVAEPAPAYIRPYIWNYPYISGLMTTERSFSQLYGVFEMRAQMPKGRGLWPAFWLLPANHKWPPEIDIFEILGDDTHTLHTNAHDVSSGRQTDAPSVIRIPDASSSFHNYAIDWMPDSLVWYFDGIEVARKPTPVDMRYPMYLLVNLAVGGHWPGSPDETTPFPAALSIQWIHVYQHESIE